MTLVRIAQIGYVKIIWLQKKKVHFRWCVFLIYNYNYSNGSAEKRQVFYPYLSVIVLVRIINYYLFKKYSI